MKPTEIESVLNFFAETKEQPIVSQAIVEAIKRGEYLKTAEFLQLESNGISPTFKEKLTLALKYMLLNNKDRATDLRIINQLIFTLTEIKTNN
jgi:hypothetical protein